MVSAGLWGTLRIEINPLILKGFKLCQIVKVDSSFASVASEKEYAILKW